jgi:hypothetical protein
MSRVLGCDYRRTEPVPTGTSENPTAECQGLEQPGCHHEEAVGASSALR